MKIFDIKKYIENGDSVIGIELGSTRIKSVLIGEDNLPLATGSFSWENKLADGLWTYAIDEIWQGLQQCFAELKMDVLNKYGVKLRSAKAIGISAMMHGYMPFDESGNLLTPFRTWRNVRQQEASKILTKLFDFHVPERWTVAHLYQAVLNKEEHVSKISHVTTLAGYVHFELTGERVVGVGDGSGIFPLDNAKKNYNENFLKVFDDMLENAHLPYKLEEIIPKIRLAGESAGRLSKKGALLLDPTGEFESGILFSPPEGDAETGMAATNSVDKNTGNVSAGTSAFAMLILDKPLKKAYPEIDIVATPSGTEVAMVHCNNCTTDVNSWIDLFGGALEKFGCKVDKNELYQKMFKMALCGDEDCGNLLSFNNFSGEHICDMVEGRPLLIRSATSNFNVQNVMKANLYSALSVLRMGFDILKEEKIQMKSLVGHGGFFKTKNVGQKIMAEALNCPISVLQTANEGGAWGSALLASYLVNKKKNQTLGQFLNKSVFQNVEISTYSPTNEGVLEYERYHQKYLNSMSVEVAAIKTFKE